MSAPICEVCSDRPVPDQAYACSRCTGKMAEQLDSIVALAPEVEAAIARLTRYGTAGGSDRHPLPVDLQAAERAAEIGNTVATWARHVSESRGKPIPVPARAIIGPLCRHGCGCRHETCEAIRTRYRGIGVAVAAGWLIGQLEWLRHQPEAAEACDELGDAANRLKSLVGGPLPRWYAGSCWTDLGELDERADPLRCQEDLYAAPGARTVKCRVCGTEHDAAARMEWLLGEARDTLAHAEMIGRALGALGIEDCTPARVRGMARHGRLANRGTDPAGRPLYRVGDVLDVIEEQVRMEAERKVRREANAARRVARGSCATPSVNLA